MNTENIEIGMLVQLRLRAKSGYPSDVKIARKYNGHIGEVLELYDSHYIFGPRWTVEGADPEHLCFPEGELYPLKGDSLDEEDEQSQRKGDTTPCEPEFLTEFQQLISTREEEKET